MLSTNVASILRPGAYTRGYEIFQILSKPHIQLLLSFIESNPGCSSKQILKDAGLGKSATRISQMISEVHELDVIIINPVGKTNNIKMDLEKVQEINNTVARLL